MTIQNDKATSRVNLDAMYAFKLAGSLSSNATNHLNKGSIARKVNDTVIAVTVRNEDVAVPSNSNVAWAIKGLGLTVVASNALCAKCLDLLPVHGELVNHLVVSVTDPDEAFTIDIDVVEIEEQALTPGVLELALTVED
jgi:hypothetical protein